MYLHLSQCIGSYKSYFLHRQLAGFAKSRDVSRPRRSDCNRASSASEWQISFCVFFCWWWSILVETKIQRSIGGVGGTSPIAIEICRFLSCFTVERVFSKHLWIAFVVVFLAEMGRIPCCGRPESSSSNI